MKICVFVMLRYYQITLSRIHLKWAQHPQIQMFWLQKQLQHESSESVEQRRTKRPCQSYWIHQNKTMLQTIKIKLSMRKSNKWISIFLKHLKLGNIFSSIISYLGKTLEKFSHCIEIDSIRAVEYNTLLCNCFCQLLLDKVISMIWQFMILRLNNTPYLAFIWKNMYFTLHVSVFPDPAGPDGAPPSFMFRAHINVLIALSVNGVITRRLAFPKYSNPYSI